MCESNYYNYLCAWYGEEDFSSHLPREFYPASEYCTISVKPTRKVSTLKDLCIRHVHQNLALTTQADYRSTFYDYTPQKSVIRNLPIPNHSSIFEKSNTFITALYFVKCDSPLYKRLESLGEPSRNCIDEYYRRKDFLYKLHRAIPFYSEDFSESDRYELFQSVATDLIRSEKLYSK